MERAIQASSPTGDRALVETIWRSWWRKPNSVVRGLHSGAVDWGLSTKPPDLVFALFTTGAKQISLLLSVISMRNKKKIKQKQTENKIENKIDPKTESYQGLAKI